MQARECAFKALNTFFKEGIFLEKSLGEFRERLSTQDDGFLKRLSYGVIKNYLGLSEYLKSLDHSKTRLKRSEKLIAVIGLYQILLMDSVPDYAAVNETLNLAKKHVHASFVKKLSAVLRRADKKSYDLFLHSKGYSTRYSISQDLVDELLLSLSKNEVEELLKVYDLSKATHFRLIKGSSKTCLDPFKEGIKEVGGAFYEVIDTKLIKEISKLKDVYFQNSTPYKLFHFLKSKEPKSLLDICSAPGGKLILAHEEFPKAKLFCNDVSEKKLCLIKENCEKYGIEPEMSCSDGLQYIGGPFDLVILDAPCSNTGVIRKKPEAKLTFSKAKLKVLVDLQKALLKKCSSLITDDGELWYMTCSILTKENEEIISYAKKALNLTVVKSLKIIPDHDGSDGGFSACLKKST